MRISITKLSSGTRDESLIKLFEPFGKVLSAKIFYDRNTGLSKKFGFIEMPNDNDANEAINKLNKSEFEGNNIVVKKAKAKNPE